MIQTELTEEELAALDDEGQVRLLAQTEQGLADDDQTPQPPQDEGFRPAQEGAVTG